MSSKNLSGMRNKTSGLTRACKGISVQNSKEIVVILGYSASAEQNDQIHTPICTDTVIYLFILIGVFMNSVSKTKCRSEIRKCSFWFHMNLLCGLCSHWWD